MDYLKFNCYDLAAQNSDLYSIYSKMMNLSEELGGILSALAPQIKSYENLQSCFRATAEVTTDISLRVLAAHNALDKIVDLYYVAESKVQEASEALPTEIAPGSSVCRASTGDTTTIAASTINSSDLVLEDWLAELVYRFNDSEEDKG